MTSPLNERSQTYLPPMAKAQTLRPSYFKNIVMPIWEWLREKCRGKHEISRKIGWIVVLERLLLILSCCKKFERAKLYKGKFHHSDNFFGQYFFWFRIIFRVDRGRGVIMDRGWGSWIIMVMGWSGITWMAKSNLHLKNRR